MSKAKQSFFTDDQVQRLILNYLHSRQDEEVSDEEVQNFLNACINIASTAHSIEMAADGLLLVRWNSVTGVFAFGLTDAGREMAEKVSAA